MPSTERDCEEGYCCDYGREEFCGYCAEHWKRLDDGERRILKADYIPGPPIIQKYVTERHVQPVIERVRTVYPARSRLSKLTLWTWRTVITAATAVQVWKWVHHG